VKGIRLIARSFADFFLDNGLMLAGSMSYFTMMAMVPLSLFLVTLFGHFLGEYPGFYKFFLSRITNFFPAVTQEITQDLAKIITFRGIGKVSLLLYGLLSYQVFASIETALDAVFKVRKRRHVLLSLLLSLGVVSLVIALLTVSFAAASLISFLKVSAPELFGIRIGGFSRLLLRFVLPFVLVMLLVVVLYVLVPQTKVRIFPALRGAFFTTVMLEIAKHAFTWYVSSVAHFGRIYGPLTAFVVFLLWMFYSWSIFLIGAEIVHNLGSRKSLRGEK
jgi:membrane protein